MTYKEDKSNGFKSIGCIGEHFLIHTYRRITE